jgi:hypothetical protein
MDADGILRGGGEIYLYNLPQKQKNFSLMQKQNAQVCTFFVTSYFNQ